MPARARVSVIVPTKYRPEVLERTVVSLFGQEELPCQVIIVDQSSSEETHERVKQQYAAALAAVRQNTQLTYVHDKRIAGAAAARNRGMDLAEGDVWLFLDDDVRLDPGFVRELLAVYGSWPQATGVSGVFTNYRPYPWLNRLWRQIFLRGPFHDERQSIYWNADRLRAEKPVRVRKFTGALMSFRAEAVRDRRFDENIWKTGAEDLDFCTRLQPGSVLLVAPAARVFHERAPGGRSDAHWAQTELEMMYYLYKRNWSTGIWNRLYFAWLLTGYLFATAAASMRRRSLAPLRGLVAGIKDGGAQAGASARGQRF